MFCCMVYQVSIPQLIFLNGAEHIVLIIVTELFLNLPKIVNETVHERAVNV